MLQTPRSYRGMVTAPHHLAAGAGRRVLEEGGNAVEAMIAAAATIAVVYPHMNGLGGDNFWLVHRPGEPPIAIAATGAAAALATPEHYAAAGCEAIPSRGPLAALTVAGAVSGWAEAQSLARRMGGELPLTRLLEDAVRHAREGIAVTATQHRNGDAKRAELEDVPGFAATFMPGGEVPAEGSRFRQPRLAATLEQLARAGLDDFYRGDLARSLGADLEAAGSPLRLADLEAHHAQVVEALRLTVAGHEVLNLPPPTQGLASLLLLGVYERLGVTEAEGFEFVHALVESTKRAFIVRDAEVVDPRWMRRPAGEFLEAARLDAMAAEVDPERALPWPHEAAPGDTVWLGAVDADGVAVSFIQSVYWEFGSGLVLPGSGVTWQNRGTSFSLAPGRLPFHTIQPALARLADGRVMVYGTMGGEGQPQTQAMLFARHVLHGQPLQQAVTAPRWLLGRTWGTATTNLKLESRFHPGLFERLRAAGHDVEVVGEYEEMMGHAGALVHHPDGLVEGAADPRGDGAVAAY